MSTQQILKKPLAPIPPSPLPPDKNQPKTKEQQFMNYFDSLKNIKENSRKSSRVTCSSDYHQVFQEYAKKPSHIDSIVETFDNGHICDYFEEKQSIIQSHAFLTCSNKIKLSIQNINQFYNHLEPLEQRSKIPDLADHQPFSQFLASEIAQKNDNQEHLYQNALERIQSERLQLKFMEQKVNKKKEVQTKIDLLITEIEAEKKRKDDVKFYEEAMNIRLNEFIQYVTEDDQKYLGLSLNSKAFQLLKNINSFKGKTIEGLLKLPLLQYFFVEFRQLQKYRLSKLTGPQLRREKKEVCSELRLKSSRTSKNEKYSEPNSKRNSKVIREQDWIGNWI